MLKISSTLKNISWSNFFGASRQNALQNDFKMFAASRQKCLKINFLRQMLKTKLITASVSYVSVTEM